MFIFSTNPVSNVEYNIYISEASGKPIKKKQEGERQGRSTKQWKLAAERKLRHAFTLLISVILFVFPEDEVLRRIRSWRPQRTPYLKFYRFPGT